jgi:hypothetical protein
VQHGFLRLPFSRNETARGNLKTPVTVVKRGDGPTALLTGRQLRRRRRWPISPRRAIRPTSPGG